ncbi:hypothetical protein RhiJN_10860 [Ceratobasidium sp. AG-Ba]|nr:hypothetical protein RhiJN_10860 [Ceratobasidium sp. AG-Ba]QRW11594.1 hypothetical protein RhiLY_10593 [Ceratobasidium sp. AG-Ba]
MIIPESERSESKAPTVRSGVSETSWRDPPSPPPYTATIASSDDHYQRDHPVSSHSNPPSTPRPDLPPRCNYLIERKANASISGTWHVDTALTIPERLLPPITEYDGPWNQDVQKARKLREKEMKRREREGGRTALPMVPEVRPNLMLGSTNGSIKGDVHVVSSDGLTRQVVIVAQGTNGAITLNVHASEQPLRVYATSTNGSVSVRVPMSFEGAVTMATTWGSVKISDAMKAKLTTFSTTSNTTRSFIGDWQSSGFGSTPNHADPNDDPPLPAIDNDPFTSWNGPLIHLSSTNGSVSLSYIEEAAASQPSSFSRAMRGWMSGWFGGGASGSGGGSSGPQNPPYQPSSLSHPSHPGSDAGSGGGWPNDAKSPNGPGSNPVPDLD